MQSLEIEEPPAAHAHGGAEDLHTAVDVGGDEEVRGPTAHLQQEGYSRRDRSRQEKAGLLNGAALSDGSHAGPHALALCCKLLRSVPRWCLFEAAQRTWTPPTLCTCSSLALPGEAAVRRFVPYRGCQQVPAEIRHAALQQWSSCDA